MSEKQHKDTMELWNRLFETPVQYTRNFDRGSYRGTDISPQFRWMRLTEVFGPCGIGWGIDSFHKEILDLPGNEKMVVFTITCWYEQNGQKYKTPPGFGQEYIVKLTRSGLRSDDDAYKKAWTDALGNAWKYVGLCGDIYLNLHSESKYTDYLKQKYSAEPEKKEQAPEPDQRENRRVAIEMMGLNVDPGESFFITTPSGTIQFVEQEKEENWHVISLLMEKAMIAMPSVDELVEFANTNKLCREILMDKFQDDPVQRGAYHWARVRLETVKDLTSEKLTKSWAKISRKVNALKNTQPSIYAGITSCFREMKAEIAAEAENKDGTD